MNGKALMVLLTVMGLVFGLAGGVVTATWTLEDRIGAKIEKALEPINEKLNQIEALIKLRWR